MNGLFGFGTYFLIQIHCPTTYLKLNIKRSPSNANYLALHFLCYQSLIQHEEEVYKCGMISVWRESGAFPRARAPACLERPCRPLAFDARTLKT